MKDRRPVFCGLLLCRHGLARAPTTVCTKSHSRPKSGRSGTSSTRAPRSSSTTRPPTVGRSSPRLSARSLRDRRLALHDARHPCIIVRISQRDVAMVCTHPRFGRGVAGGWPLAYPWGDASRCSSHAVQLETIAASGPSRASLCVASPLTPSAAALPGVARSTSSRKDEGIYYGDLSPP